MKATIHFNADRIVILNETNIAVACLPSYLGIPKEGANWLKSKLLPSLPSTLSCEYSEENGKIEVKKIWI